MSVTSVRRLFAAALPLAAVLSLCTIVPELRTSAQSPDTAMMFTEDDLSAERIGGKWNMGIMLDWAQIKTPSAPVVVVGVMSFPGRGEYVGLMKLAKATLNNRGPVPVKSVRLRWTLTRPDEPKVILLEGVTPPFDAEIAPGAKFKTVTPHLLVNRIAKPILENGELNGTYQLTVGVEEVFFADGSAWRRADVPQP